MSFLEGSRSSADALSGRYTLAFCDASAVPRVMQFIDAHYRKGHPLARHRDLFDWQYGNPGSYNMVVATAEATGDILGILGFVDLARYDPALASHNGVWLALWQVDPQARIPALGPSLLQFLVDHVPHETLAVSGIRRVLAPMYRAMRFTVGTFAHHFLLNPTIDTFRIAVVPAGRIVGCRPSRSDLRLRRVSRGTLPTLDAAATTVAHRPLKSARYFFERYLSHPFYEYDVYEIIKEGTSIGLVATRIVEHDGRRAMRIVDVAVDPLLLDQLGAPLLEEIMARDCEYGDLLQRGMDDTALHAAGFARVIPEAGVVIPNYFEPFVAENTEIITCVRDAVGGPFVVCKADGDQDRPNLLERD